MIDSIGVLATEYPVVIHPDLKDYLPCADDRTTSDLEQALIRSGGAIDPITVWNGALVDGHRRYALCKKHSLPLLGGVRHLKFKNLRDVKFWMDSYQISRRNLSGHQWSMVVARMDKYLDEEKQAGRFAGNTIKEIAKAHGVSKATVCRAKQNGEALEKVSEPIRNRILTGEVKVSMQAVKELATMPEREQVAVVNAYDRGDHKSLNKAILGEDANDSCNIDIRSHGETSCAQTTQITQLNKGGLTEFDAAMKQLGLLGKAVDALNAAKPDDRRQKQIRSYVSNIRNLLAGWKGGSDVGDQRAQG